MKKTIVILLCVVFACGFAALGIKPAVLFLVKKQIRAILKGSEVSIGSCNLDPLKRFSLYDISIKNHDTYTVLVKEATAEYSIGSILRGEIERLAIAVDSLRAGDLEVSGIILNAVQGAGGGHFAINRITYSKANITEVNSQARLSGKELLLERLSARVFDGTIGGTVRFGIDREAACDAALKVTAIDAARFVDDFDLKEKFEMTGRLSGDLVFKSKGPEIKVLDGKISSLESGGMLNIKDTAFLENLARASNQPLELLVANLRDYHYNIAGIKLFTENENLALKTVFDGETGKRTINIILHDFRLQKEGR
jgi:hypothetical protein